MLILASVPAIYILIVGAVIFREFIPYHKRLKEEKRKQAIKDQEKQAVVEAANIEPNPFRKNSV